MSKLRFLDLTRSYVYMNRTQEATMADIPTENMVLRTLYIPLETDRQLKALAFTREVSKGELMRELIKQGLATIAASGERSLAEQLSARLSAAKPATSTKANAPVKAPAASRERGATTRARNPVRKPREMVAAG